MNMASRGIVSDIKIFAVICVFAAVATYASLLVPGRAIAVCANLGEPIYCPVPAYGFPMPFLADSRSTSPINSVARDPLSILIGLDDILWLPLGMSMSFWTLVLMAGRLAWRRWFAPAAGSDKARSHNN